jgi:cytochrome c5
MKLFSFLIVLMMIAGIFNLGCQSDSGDKSSSSAQKSAQPQGQQLSEWEMQNGIGPIKSKVEIGPIDNSLKETGKKVFEAKCTACHKFDERYVGPPLRDVTKRRSPEFVMNQILNPDENVKRHPEGKKMLAEYLTPMTFMNVTEADARALLEYLRFEAQKSTR